MSLKKETMEDEVVEEVTGDEEYITIEKANEEREDDSISNKTKSEGYHKERKGGSYVWHFCDRLSKVTIRCNLCKKVMCFHGTANVITHLQRKHNINGKNDCESEFAKAANYENTATSVGKCKDDDMESLKPKRRITPHSIVWKYCTRLSKDVVRCGFCKKNLSYQGTSNLQRHLDRMHGVVTRTRKRNDIRKLFYSQEFIMQYCKLVGNDELKCNLCGARFDKFNTEKIGKHLTIDHDIQMNDDVSSSSSLRKRSKRNCSGTDDQETSEEDDNDDADEYFLKDWVNNNKEQSPVKQNSTLKNFSLVANNTSSLKKEEPSLCDELIEEDLADCHGDPFDVNTLQEIPIANPLSTPSSRSASPEASPSSKKDSLNKKLEKLKEERLRSETEYFRQKAGYYRMQKYLIALEARKVRFELERMTTSQNSTEVYTTVATLAPTSPNSAQPI